MKKKFFSNFFCILCALIFGVGMAGCGTGTDGDSSSADPEPEPVYIDNPIVEKDMADPHILR